EFAVGSTTAAATIVGAAPSLFGYSLVLGPTVGGNPTFLIGAPTAGASAGGEAYLVDEVTHAILKTFTRPGGSVVFDLFGYAVTRLNGNFVVSAPGADAGQTDAGQVYVFQNSAGYPLLDTISKPTPAASDIFGVALAGTNRLAVGATGDDTG